MSSKSDYLEDEILDHMLGGGDYTRPATVYIALYTAAPSDAGGGTEVSAGDYARKSVTNNATNWPAASSSQKQNGTEIAFTEAVNSWGTVTHFSIMDAVSAGNFLFWGVLTNSKTIDIGDTFKFPINAITITED